MKAHSIALVLAGMAFAGLGQSVPEGASLVTARRIDPLAMQMQMAVLTMQDTNKVADLLKQGVDINAPIGCGTFSPLDGAVSRGNLEMLRFLLAHGAKPRGPELADAAFMENPPTALNLAKALLEAGVNPNATNRYSTPLTSAAYQDNQDLVALLLTQPGINVDAHDVDGYTALMWAAKHGSLDLVTMLLKAGANPNMKNSHGETAASLAAQDIATRRAIISKLKSKSK